MIKAYIPDSFVAERKYALHILFSTLLNSEISVEINAKLRQTVIETDKWSWYFDDHFFSSVKDIDSIYSKENLPNPTLGVKPLEDLVIFYGQNNFEEDAAKNQTHVGFDILGSIFFMTTRWEETLGPYDQHDRFLAKDAIAQKHDFLHRPIVHEYALWFRNQMTQKGIPAKAHRQYRKVYTCDVDYPMFWDKSSFKRKADEILFRKVFQRRDPYFVFDEMMSDAEQQNLQIQFNFIAGGKALFDTNYEVEHPNIKALLGVIKDRGHAIGLHGSYDSYDDVSLLHQEKKNLESVAQIDIQHARQHFLRFKMPGTWRHLSQINIQSDSTLGYPDQPGFRTGMCIPFPVFDIEERKMLPLLEQPLILMDATLRHYMNESNERYINIVDSLTDQIKKHRGEFVFLWHNSSFRKGGYEKLRPVYNHILSCK